MAFYEVIYETGAHSILESDDEDAMLAGLQEQHRRAVNGEKGYQSAGDSINGSMNHTAERVKRVLKYDEHPGAPGGEDAPTVASSAHESNYELDHVQELDLEDLFKAAEAQ